jgi:hypothetical protein
MREPEPWLEAVMAFRSACVGRTTWKEATSKMTSLAILSRALPEMDDLERDDIFLLWKVARQHWMDELGVTSWGERVHQW